MEPTTDRAAEGEPMTRRVSDLTLSQIAIQSLRASLSKVDLQSAETAYQSALAAAAKASQPSLASFPQ